MTLFCRFQSQEAESDKRSVDHYLDHEHQFSVLYNTFMEVGFRFHINIDVGYIGLSRSFRLIEGKIIKRY